MLELVEVVKHFASPDGEVVRAVDGVSLTVSAGEIVALYGPSGSGKTTLLKLVAALLAPDSGTVVVAGRDICSLSRRDAAAYRLDTVGLLRQTAEFIPGGTALDNAAFKLLGRYRMPEARRRVASLMVELGLGDRLDHHGHQLSGGERQRVMIARALAIDPAIVLADEPTGNLDSRRGEEVLALLRRVSYERSAATILVTHDPLAARFADRVVELRDGRLRPPSPDAASA